MREFQNSYPLALDKIEIKKEMLSIPQLMIAYFYNAPVSNIKKSVPNLFDKEKYVLHCKNFQLYLMLKLKLNKIHRVLEFKSITVVKVICRN